MKFPSTALTARITEIFSSLQGEGPYAGTKHIFVRFEECHMHCSFCDEIHKVGKDWSLDDTLNEILRLEQAYGPHQHVSLTGGEPLLYLPFIQPLIQALREKGLKIYLETSGVLWKALDEVLENCDVIAMDLKPASVTHEKNYLEDHRQFLTTSKNKNVFLKMVVSKEISVDEYDTHVQMVAETASQVSLYLQPITTPQGEGHEDAELMKLISDLQKRGQQWLSDIRIGVRLHRILNIR